MQKIDNGKLFALFLVIFILLVIPASFANDNVTVNEDVCLCEDVLEADDETVSLEESNLEIYVNSYNGTAGGSGTQDNPVKSISDALNFESSNKTIYLTGKFSGIGNSNLTFDNQGTISFIGLGEAVIDGNYSTSFAVMSKGSYAFKNISFVNNYKSGEDLLVGGVFENGKDSTLTLENCLFENNAVFGDTHANGGAIDNMGNLIINECIFRNNQVNISDSESFRKNAADGGAISNLGVMKIYGSIFESNRALRNGGAIRAQDRATTYIENSQFRQNLAAYHLSGGCYGGAIYIWDSGLEVYNSTFIGNAIIETAGNGAQGGAIFSDRGNKLINIQGCEFINNTVTGLGAVLGQSIYIGSVSENINYCYIDTSIYSASQNVNLDYNWWDSNNLRNLIESLPSSVKINRFAQLKLSTDAAEIYSGCSINIFARLVWNGTNNPEGMELFSPKTVNLTADCGILAENRGILKNGVFNTTLVVTNLKDSIIMADVGRMSSQLNLSNGEIDFTMSAVTNDIDEGETAVIQIYMNKDASGICMIDIGENNYYVRLDNNMATAYIRNLDPGVYNVSITYPGDENNEAENTTVPLTVNAKTKPATKINTNLIVAPVTKFVACDNKAGEQGRFLEVQLKDAMGNALKGMAVQIALDGPIYNLTTDNSGFVKLNVANLDAGKHYCVISFSGDETYNFAPLKTAVLNVAKKSTKISAKSKNFKVKSTKKIKVTLKTVKNSYDGKTYLKSGKKLTLTVKGKKYVAKTNKKGVAKFTIKLNKKGKYSASIKFGGDSIYKSCKKTIKITVK